MSCFEFFGDEKYGIFEPKSWWKYGIYWLLKSSCFDLFENGKYGLFLCQKLDGKMIFTDYWKLLFWTFRWWEIRFFLSQEVDGNMVFTDYWKLLFWTFWWCEIRSFFESRSWWKDDIYWLLRSSCFEFFGDGKYGLFFIQKVDWKITFILSFWAFHDIPVLRKYGFSCSSV